MNIKIKLETEGAKIPTKANPTDAGWDLYYDGEDGFTVDLLPGHRVLLSLGFSTEFYARDNKHFCAIIKDRSGNAVKKGLHVLAGVIDHDYRGIWRVCLVNLGDEVVIINKWDKIAQAILTEVPRVQWYDSKTLSETNRGAKGFGSSG